MEVDDILAMYDRHARALTGFFVRRTSDPQLALDLLGDTFVSAFEARDRCRAQADSPAAAAWLFRIAANNLAAHYRRRASERRATDRLGRLRAISSDEELELRRLGELDEDEQLAAAFDALPGEQREAVRLHVLEDQGYTAMSSRLGVSEPAARARVSRGLRALRRAIASESKGDPG